MWNWNKYSPCIDWILNKSTSKKAKSGLCRHLWGVAGTVWTTAYLQRSFKVRYATSKFKSWPRSARQWCIPRNHSHKKLASIYRSSHFISHWWTIGSIMCLSDPELTTRLTRAEHLQRELPELLSPFIIKLTYAAQSNDSDSKRIVMKDKEIILELHKRQLPAQHKKKQLTVRALTFLKTTRRQPPIVLQSLHRR